MCYVLFLFIHFPPLLFLPFPPSFTSPVDPPIGHFRWRTEKNWESLLADFLTHLPRYISDRLTSNNYACILFPSYANLFSLMIYLCLVLCYPFRTRYRCSVLVIIGQNLTDNRTVSATFPDWRTVAVEEQWIQIHLLLYIFNRISEMIELNVRVFAVVVCWVDKPLLKSSTTRRIGWCNNCSPSLVHASVAPIGRPSICPEQFTWAHTHH